MGDEAGERGDQAAAAAAHRAVAVLVALELGGTPVRDDDQRLRPHIAAKITGAGRARSSGPVNAAQVSSRRQQVEPVAQQARREELAAGVLLAFAAERLAEARVLEDLEAALRRTPRAS